MSIFKSILQKTSSIQGVVIIFVISHLVLIAMMLFTFPIIESQLGTKVFDLHTFGYSMDVAKTIVTKLDTQSLGTYIFPQLTLLDVLYPFLLAMLLSSILYRFEKGVTILGKIILLIPFIAMTFDYIENVFILLMITKSVEVSESIVMLSSLATVVKGVCTSIAWGIILIYFIKCLVHKISDKMQKEVSSRTQVKY